MGHRLKPVITIGNGGLTSSVRRELESTIDHHELIKVRVRTGDRALRDTIISQLCVDSSAEMVTRIGNVALIYKANPEAPRIKLPA